MRKSVLFAAAVALTGCLTGCLDDVEVGDSTVNGSYVLRTVNGSPPPYVIATASGVKTEIVSQTRTRDSLVVVLRK